MDELDAMKKMMRDMNAGAATKVSRVRGGTVVEIVCVYVQDEHDTGTNLAEFLEELEELEDKYGYGR